jgi:hypothetical protein
MADAGGRSKKRARRRKDRRKNGEPYHTTPPEELTRNDVRQLATRLASGLDYHTDDELDELARQAAESFLNDPSGPFREFEHDGIRRFLRAYSVTGVIAKAARLAGIDRTLIYQEPWKSDQQFQQALDVAALAGADSLMEEMYRRGVEGVEKPVGWYKGDAGGTVMEYSDQLLVRLVTASAHGDKFREKMDVRGSFANLNIDNIDMNRLPAPVTAALANGTALAVALIEYVARMAEVAQAELPAGRDVSPQPDTSDD